MYLLPEIEEYWRAQKDHIFLYLIDHSLKRALLLEEARI